ncbi:putative porin [Aquabacterium sp.]|uniref:putative porin n=1 Tax=Aquabacterium sp. TaxID=1872578 RepID=UPI0035ADB7E3
MTNKMFPRIPLALSATAMAIVLSQPQLAMADERAELEQLRASTMALVQALVDSGLLSRERAEAILKQSQQARPSGATSPDAAKPAAPATAPGVVRVPYISETTKAELREQIKAEVLEQAKTERWAQPNVLPEWFGRLTIDGDVRFRFEQDSFDKGNYPAGYYQLAVASGATPMWAPDLTNTTNDRTRTTLRARLGVTAKLADNLASGIRIASGALSNGATSTSQTLGAGLNRYNVGLDRAWIKWAPAEGLDFNAGRFANPFFGTDLTWPDDLNFDGVALGYQRPWGSSNKAFATAGVFPLQEFSTGGDANKWLYGAQIGTQLRLTAQTDFKIGLAMYDFNGIEGVQESAYKSDAEAKASTYLSTQYPDTWRQKGNTLVNINPVNDPIFPSGKAPVYGLASKFKPFNLSMMLNFHQFDPIGVQLWFDYLKNTGWDLSDIRTRAGDSTIDLEGKTQAYQLRVNVGKQQIERAGDWQAFAALRRLERDAWVDAFTDTTWNLGGTNYTGWSLGGQYGVANRTSVGLRLTSTRNLKDASSSTSTVDLSSAPFKLDVWQLELNSRF